jgi:ribosomal protein L29
MTTSKKVSKMKIQEIRKLKQEDLDKRLSELRLELGKELGGAKMGRSSKNPGKLGQLRKSISRILTVKGELERSDSNNAAAKKTGIKAAVLDSNVQKPAVHEKQAKAPDASKKKVKSTKEKPDKDVKKKS